jgi:hypothetical protein
MYKINVANLFNNSLILADRVVVNSLEEGAKQYGGATQLNTNYIFSNYNTTNTINIYKSNTLGIIVPGTINVNTNIDNTIYKQYVIKTLNNSNITNIKDTAVLGAWIADSGECVVENNNMLTFSTQSTNLIQQLKQLKQIAQYLKQQLKQEAISIIVNNSLIIY